MVEELQIVGQVVILCYDEQRVMIAVLKRYAEPHKVGMGFVVLIAIDLEKTSLLVSDDDVPGLAGCVSGFGIRGELDEFVEFIHDACAGSDLDALLFQSRCYIREEIFDAVTVVNKRVGVKQELAFARDSARKERWTAAIVMPLRNVCGKCHVVLLYFRVFVDEPVVCSGLLDFIDC